MQRIAALRDSRLRRSLMTGRLRASQTTTQRLVAFVEEAFDNGRDALGTLGRHIDKVGRTHELVLVDVLADRAQCLFVVARRKRKVTVVLGEDGKTRDTGLSPRRRAAI